MRPARLVVLAGLLVAAGGLYLGYLQVDGAAFEALAGRDTPTIWAEFGTPERIVAVGVVAALVALAFRPHAGSWDLWGGAGAQVLALALVAGAVVIRATAVSDAAAVAELLPAAPGIGFLVVLTGAAVTLGGAGWDLFAAWRGEQSRGVQSARTTLPPASDETLASDSTRQP
jgi:hypothetical protein